MGSPLVPHLVSQKTVDVPNPAPGTGPEGHVTVTEIDPVAKTVTLDGKPSAADLDAVEEEKKIADATAGSGAPPSLPNSTSHVTGVAGGPLNPSLDSVKFDSAGNEKEDVGPLGPRGTNVPLDVMTDADRAALAQKQEARLQKGMSSTVHTDSVGNKKGEFETSSHGHDKHGARIPDKVDYLKPVETPAMVGPRGKGAQPDTYHGSKPAGR